MIDFAHLHDLLADNMENETYSREARESFRILHNALRKVYEDGVRDGVKYGAGNIQTEGAK